MSGIITIIAGAIIVLVVLALIVIWDVQTRCIHCGRKSTFIALHEHCPFCTHNRRDTHA